MAKCSTGVVTMGTDMKRRDTKQGTLTGLLAKECDGER